jgi:hypothetical protein
VRVHDAETGAPAWVDTSSKRVRQELEKKFRSWQNSVKYECQRSGVDYVQLSTDRDYVRTLVEFFKRRELRR